MTPHDNPPDGAESHISDNVITLIEKVLSLRYLRGLSDEKREELRDDLDFIRRTLVDQRAPRLAIVGDPSLDLEVLLRAIVGESLPDDVDVKAYLGRGRWYDYDVANTSLELLDLRRQDEDDLSFKALERQTPDLVLYAWDSRSLGEEGSPAASDLEDLVDAVQTARSIEGWAPPVLTLFDQASLPEDVTANRASRHLRSILRDSEIADTRFRVTPLQDVRALDADLIELAPMEARLQLAQAVQTAESKRRLARLIIRASAGVTATVATIPLPIADILPITSVQILMISSIAHLSGRKLSLKTVGEFAAAVGLNVGAGYALREIARALIQFIPFAGSVVSSGIAAGATYALGNAAARYFIDEDLDDFDAAPERVSEPAWQATNAETVEPSSR